MKDFYCLSSREKLSTKKILFVNSLSICTFCSPNPNTGTEDPKDHLVRFS